MSTNDLYKELRTAMRSRDDAQALRVLRQIVAVDPSDADAAQQLADYEARMMKKPEAMEEAGSADDKQALTAPFYRKLRSAIRSNNLPEAHGYLTQILEIAPADENARQQIKEVGQQLVKASAQDLQNILDSGDVNAICRKVAELRSYCQDEEVLSSISAWSAAAHIAEQKRLREMTARLEEMFDDLDTTQDIEARYKKVEAIAKFAMAERLELSSGQSQKVKAARLVWQQFTRQQELEARYSELQDDYASIKQSFQDNKQPLPCLASLEECEKQLEEIASELDVTTLADKLRKLKKRLLDAHQTMVRVRRAKRIAVTLSIIAFLTLTGAVVYAYENVRSRYMALEEAYKNRDVVLVESMLNNHPSLVYISRKINSAYDALCNDCLSWMDMWHKDSRKLKDYMYWIQSNEKNITQNNIDQHVEQFVRINIFLDEYEKKYKLTHQQDYLQHIKQFDIKLGSVRASLCDRLTTFPHGTGLDKLKSELDYYHSIKRIFTNEMAQHIEQAIVAAANKKMREYVPESLEKVSDAQLKEARDLYNKYKDSLSLDSGIDNQIKQYENSRHWLKSLPDQLARCHSLQDYLKVLKQDETAYKTLNGAPLNEIEKFRADEDSLVAQYTAYIYLSKHSKREVSTPEKSLAVIDAAKKVYLEGKSLFTGRRSTAVNSVINKMTNHKSALWSNQFQSLRKGKDVYVGMFSFINDVCTLKPCNTDGSLSRKRQNLGYVVDKPDEIRLHGLPERLGFKRMDLQRGIVLPVNLMKNVASYSHNSCPEQARAYLFGLAVEFIEALNSPTLSGTAWSESLRNDINNFKRIAHETNLKEGSWLKNHNYEIKYKWKVFFDGVNKRDYLAEIKKSLSNALEGSTKFVGYVGPDREAVLSSNVSSQASLHVMSEGSLQPFKPQHFKAYLPLYAVNLD